MKQTSKVEIYVAFLFGTSLILGVLAFAPSLSPGAHDNLAKCLNQSGAVFYGAFWCPHCAAQKKLFGNSMKYVNYVECSTPDLNTTQICRDMNITGYPTWILSNGSRVSGVIALENLSLFTGCSLNETKN